MNKSFGAVVAFWLLGTAIRAEITNGLALYYKFDGDEGGVVTDFGPYGYRGTNYGAVFTVDGKKGGAMSFTNGAYIITGDVLDLSGPRTAQTVTAWVRLTKKQNIDYCAIVNKARVNTPYTQWHLGVLVSRPIADIVPDYFSQCYSLPTNNVLDAQWHFLCGTYEVSPTRRRTVIYVDGVQQSEAVVNNNGNTDTTAPLTIGNTSPPGLTQQASGLIDEVRIYDRILTSNEIYELFSPPLTNGSCQLQSGLDLYYSFDEDVAGTITDYGPHGHHATNFGAVYTTLGRAGGALSFTNGAYVAAGDILDLTGARPDQTVCAWVRLTKNQSIDYCAIAHKGITAMPYTQWHLGVLESKPMAEVIPNSFSRGFAIPTNQVLDGQWHFICGTYATTPTSRMVRVYLDGILRATTVTNSNGTTDTPNALTIGNTSPPGLTQPASGLIDEVRIYGRILSDEEILCLYENPSGSPGLDLDIGFARAYPIVGAPGHRYQLQGRDTPFTNEWYDVGEPVAGTGGVVYVYERSPNPLFFPSRRFQVTTNTDQWSLFFDGVDDLAYRAHDPILNLTNGMTLGCWIKPSRYGVAWLISKAVSSSIFCYGLGLDVSNRPVYQLVNAAGVPMATLIGTNSLATGNWHHVAATWDENLARLYVNGNLITSIAATGSLRSSSISSFQLGSLLGNQSFQGLMDQVQVWSVARSGPEMSSSYQNTLAGSEPGLAGYYPLNSPDPTAVPDSTPNQVDLTPGTEPVADASDPVWTGESFPSPAYHEEIFDAGEIRLVVGHPAQASTRWQLQATTNTLMPDWQDFGSIHTSTAAQVNYMIMPNRPYLLYRLISKP